MFERNDLLLELSLQQIFTRVIAIMIVSGVHGFVTAQVAGWRGDAEPAHQGRRTLSPFSHLDLIGGLGLLLFGLGWIRPIQVEKAELRSPTRDLFLIALCGFAGVFLVAILAYMLRPLAFTALPTGPGIAAVAALDATARIGLWFVLLNVLPIPPLTGRYFAYALLPQKTVRALDQYTTHASVLLGLLILTGAASGLVVPYLRSATNALLDVL